jgi:osmoprotectant transport system permease protein
MQASVIPTLIRLAVLILAFAFGAWAYATGVLPDILGKWDDISYLGAQHLQLVAISAGLAIAVGVLLGIFLSRPRVQRYANALLQLLNIGSTIPTLAVLALSMTLLGIGERPAIFGLFVATLLPVTGNTLAGIRAVSPVLIEAAVGMGMTSRQILWEVELPNALFVIFAGVRTGVAINIGTAPLAFLIGGGGLGELIFTGIALNEFSTMLAGAIPVALIAIGVDFVLSQLQYRLIPRGVNPLR